MLEKMRLFASNKRSFKKQPSKKQKKDDLRILAEIKGIEGYERMSEERLISSISELAKKSERIEKIKNDFNELRDRLSKPKIKEIRKDLYKIKNKKIGEVEKNLKLEKCLSQLKKYYYYEDDIKYRGIMDVKTLIDLSTDEDYYKPVRTNDAFNSNHVEYKSKGHENKTFSIEEYLNMIRTYLRDIINNHKIQGEREVHSDNEVIDYKTEGEWKIHLTMRINFISSKDSDEIRTMHTTSNNIEIMMSNETDKIIGELFE